MLNAVIANIKRLSFRDFFGTFASGNRPLGSLDHNYKESEVHYALATERVMFNWKHFTANQSKPHEVSSRILSSSFIFPKMYCRVKTMLEGRFGHSLMLADHNARAEKERSIAHN